jgi:hypothetical protein
MSNQDKTDEMLNEYDFDYSKAKPNRFAQKYRQDQRTVVLDDDVANDFPSAEAVNEALRKLSKMNDSQEIESK